jgi:hypothetical protein
MQRKSLAKNGFYSTLLTPTITYDGNIVIAETDPAFAPATHLKTLELELASA